MLRKKKNKKDVQIFFNSNSKYWKKSYKISKNKYNLNHHRLHLANKIVKKLNLKNILDVGCGTGELGRKSSSHIKSYVGVDFSSAMLKLAKKINQNNKKITFFENDFLNFETNMKFDCIVANGFIQYNSTKNILIIFNRFNKLLKKNKYLIFTSRNRLFNLFSLNNLTKQELVHKTFKNFYKECIFLNEYKLDKFVKLRLNKFKETNIRQMNTKIKIKNRQQFSPLQIVDLLNKSKFMLIDILPLNFHPTINSKFENHLIYKKFKTFIHSQKKNKLKYLFQCPNFIVIAKKI